MERMVAHGGDVNLRDANGRTPLGVLCDVLKSAKRGEMEIAESPHVRRLRELGAVE